jgi:hypothetical protein
LLQEQIDTHLFAPFADTVEVVPATLGEEVVVIGAVLLGQSLP